MSSLQPTPSLKSYTSDDTLGLYYIESISTPKLNRAISDLAKHIIVDYKDDSNPLDELDDWTLIEIIRDFIDDNQIEVENYSNICYNDSIKANTKLRLKACIKALLKMKDQDMQMPNQQNTKVHFIPSSIESINEDDDDDDFEDPQAGIIWANMYSERAPSLRQLMVESSARSLPMPPPPPQELNQDSSYLIPENVVHKVPKMKVNSPSSLKPEQYDKIGGFFTKKMRALIQKKTEQQMKNEFENPECRYSVLEAKNVTKCPCIERICVVLEIYHKFDFLARKPIRPMRLAEKLRLDSYSEKELSDDFFHIQNNHFLNDNNSQLFICNEIQKLYACNADTNCCTSQRHLARKEDKLYTLPELTRVQSSHSDYNEQDLVYSQKCDEIHYYFLHSLVKHGKRPIENTNNTTQTNANNQNKNNNNNNKSNNKEKKEEKKDYDSDKSDNNPINNPLSPSPPNNNVHDFETTYIGAQEDKEWMDNIKDIDIRDEQRLYNTLVKHMGVFKWQKPFGFQDQRGLSHIRATYNNIKEEVLQNQFHSIPADNWNQTLRKAKQFHTSWTGQKIRTRYDGTFDDAVMGHHSEWKKDVKITLQEVVTLKLYTDFDKLQFELKRCFRFESMSDIVEKCSRGHSDMVSSEKVNLQTTKVDENKQDEKQNENNNQQEQKIINELESRLTEFFHWRGSLLIFLNKFGKILESTLDNKEFILYHGVNAKMMVSPDPTTSFFGPLSTSSSYHVASTFGTDKGIVLGISSQYPRLKLCRAFDASVISDYPEEQEWLIGFIYLRVRKIYTKITKHIPFDSSIRFAFFALNLFQQQLFSMNHVLEYYVESFLQFQLFVKQNISVDNYDDVTETEGYQFLHKIYLWANPKGKDSKKFDSEHVPNICKNNSNTKMNKNEKIRKYRVCYMLTKKFEQLCLTPNQQQIVKLDCISPKLRTYFLTYCGDDILLPKQKKEKKYVLSFEKILDLFPNVEIIHFLNWYAFDDDALKKLMQIDEKRLNKLKRIKFLYFDYGDRIENHPFFYNPERLDKILKIKMEEKWKMVHRNDSAGYTIRLKKI